MINKTTERLAVSDSLFAALMGGIVVATAFAALVRPTPIPYEVIALGARGGAILVGHLLATALAFYLVFVAMNVVGEWILRLGERDASTLGPISVFVAVFYVFGIVVSLLMALPALLWWKVLIIGALGAAAMFVYPLSREPVLANDMAKAWHGIIGKPTGVVCPETAAKVTITYDARTGWIQRCSRWPKHYTCARDCVARRSPTGVV